MVRVVTHGRYRVCVYAEKGGQHNAPHCHVEWADGSCVVDIETLMILRGPVDRRALDLVRDHQAQIRTVWDLLNGQET